MLWELDYSHDTLILQVIICIRQSVISEGNDVFSFLATVGSQSFEGRVGVWLDPKTEILMFHNCFVCEGIHWNILTKFIPLCGTLKWSLPNSCTCQEFQSCFCSPINGGFLIYSGKNWWPKSWKMVLWWPTDLSRWFDVFWVSSISQLSLL